MSEMIFRPLVESMTWSYSRIKTFDDCPYRFFLKYIIGVNESPMFFSSYGSFIHKLIESFYNGEVSKEDLVIKFLTGFKQNVQGDLPKRNLVEKYIKCGVDYFGSFSPFPYNTIGVEKRVDFEIEGKRFVGYIDYLGEKGGEYYIVDNKSRDLKQRSNRAKPTSKDKELDEMLKQLYLYAEAVKQEFGKYPKALCFNCFKNGTFIEEHFNENVCHDNLKWFIEKIREIEETELFPPHPDYFGCMNICGVNKGCCYYDGGE